MVHGCFKIKAVRNKTEFLVIIKILHFKHLKIQDIQIIDKQFIILINNSKK